MANGFRYIRRYIGTFVRPMLYEIRRRRLIFKSQMLTPTQGSALVFAPHQDDESLGCGGLIALKRAAGVPVRVVYLTDGQNTYGRDRIPAPELIAKRQDEALQALTVLGVPSQEVIFLDCIDGSLNRLDSADQNTLIAKLVNLISDFQPQEVYVTYHQDGHPDHDTAARLVQSALQRLDPQPELWEYPIWSIYQLSHLNFKAPEFRHVFRLPIAPVRAQKLEAVACHRSQYIPIPPDTEGGLTQQFLRRLSSPHEFFFQYQAKAK